MSSVSRQKLETWLKSIDVSGYVIGIGDSQNPIKGRTKTWKPIIYQILDLKQPHETKQKPDIIGDIQDYQCLDKYKYGHFGTYDIAFCIEVSEYWIEPVLALYNINKFLKPGGILYISFHTVYRIHPPDGLDYLRYTPNGAIKLLEEAGFEIEEVIDREMKYPQNFTNAYNAEGMRGYKEFDDIQGVLIKAKKL